MPKLQELTVTSQKVPHAWGPTLHAARAMALLDRVLDPK